jgi:F0F1-type ATP synthase beta subunit
LKGAIVDQTTLIDSRLTNLFGFPTEDELLSTFDEESLPLFGRGGVLIEILSAMTEGKDILVIGGTAGSGKTAVLNEVQKILASGISTNVYLPGGIRQVAQDGTSIPLVLRRHAGQVIDSILFTLARYPESQARSRTLHLRCSSIFSAAV